MKNKILGAFCGAFLLFGASMSMSIENSAAAAISSGGVDIPVSIDCKGTAGHCMEYKNTTYYGKAYVTDL